MRVGIPTEIKNHEYRVAITPAGVAELTRRGHEVLIEAGAGEGSAISDRDYKAVGAQMVNTADEVWAEAELLLKVKEPIEAEYGRMRKGQTVFTYLHLAASKPCTDALMASAVGGGYPQRRRRHMSRPATTAPRHAHKRPQRASFERAGVTEGRHPSCRKCDVLSTGGPLLWTVVKAACGRLRAGEAFDESPLVTAERRPRAGGGVLDRPRRPRRRGDQEVDARIGETPLEQRLRPGLDTEGPKRLERPHRRLAPQQRRSGPSERSHHDHGDTELLGERQDPRLTIALERIERDLHGVEPPGAQRVLELAEPSGIPVRHTEAVHPPSLALCL